MAEWLLSYLDTEARLVRIADDFTRRVDERYAPQPAQTGFADGFPLLIVSDASLTDLNARLIERGAAPVPMSRFRPNLVGGITLGAAAAAFALLIDGIASPMLIVIALLINGYAAGTKTHITGYLTAGYAGMRNFGAIYGFMSALMSLASGVGPLLAGATYDRSGGYGPFLIAGSIGCVVGGLLMILMPPVRDWSGRKTG